MRTKLPEFLYGTAWKEHETARCVFDALKSGFRAVDTANQRKHYNEEGVGQGLSRAYRELGLKRELLFLQSKFTYARSQDHRKPYDEKARAGEQVLQSFESSLEHLGTDYLDSYVLHGPSQAEGLSAVDWETWDSMERILDSGRTGALGISNINLEQLSTLWEKARHKPAFVQNRCYANKRWDQEIRKFCAEKKINYQGFSLLTANSKFLESDGLHEAIAPLGEAAGKSAPQIVFRFARQLGMIPLTGTRSLDHMAADLQLHDFSLTSAQVEKLEGIAFL